MQKQKIHHSCKVEITCSDNIRTDWSRMTKDLIKKGYINIVNTIARHNDQRMLLGCPFLFFCFVFNFNIG